MNAKIKCRDCYACIVQPFKDDPRDYCRYKEAKIPADNEKRLCKHYTPGHYTPPTL